MLYISCYFFQDSTVELSEQIKEVLLQYNTAVSFDTQSGHHHQWICMSVIACRYLRSGLLEIFLDEAHQINLLSKQFVQWDQIVTRMEIAANPEEALDWFPMHIYELTLIQSWMLQSGLLHLDGTVFWALSMKEFLYFHQFFIVLNLVEVNCPFLMQGISLEVSDEIF